MVPCHLISHNMFHNLKKIKFAMLIPFGWCFRPGSREITTRLWGVIESLWKIVDALWFILEDKSIAFTRLSKRSVTPETLGTITVNNVLFLFLFTVENFEVLVIHIILFACNLDFMFDLSSRAKKENLQTPKMSPPGLSGNWRHMEKLTAKRVSPQTQQNRKIQS